MKPKLFALLLLTSPLVVANTDKNVEWVPPTERENGSPLLPSEIASYDLRCESMSGDIVLEQSVPGALDSFQTDAVFVEGSYLCKMRTVDTDGRVSSSWSESNVFTVDRCDYEVCNPLPPRSITVTPL